MRADHPRFPWLRILPIVLVAFALAACGPAEASDDPAPARERHEGEDHDEHDERAEHDENEPEGEEAGGEHDDHDTHEGDAHEGHGEELRVELSAAQRERAGLVVEAAGPGSIATARTFPGEIVLDPDRVVHVVPRAAGIVREVVRTLGDEVGQGEVLAWIESSELAEAKLDLYARQAAAVSARIRLPRARGVFRNVGRLLAALRDGGEPASLAALDELEMGEHRGHLLTAFAEVEAARAAHEQEQALRDSQVSSERERVEARAAHEKARAALLAAMDEARYRVRVEYGEAVRELQVAAFQAAAAEQRLRLLGATDEEIAALLALVPRAGTLDACLHDPSEHEDGEHGCESAHAPDVRAAIAGDPGFARSPLRSPIAGHVIDKHLSPGERAGDEESVFAIADTSVVWARFHVYQKDLPLVRRGLRATVETGGGVREGVVASVAPTVDGETRTVRARVVLANDDGSLRPGLYATVRVDLSSVRAPVVVPRDAVQVVDERDVVFVEDGDGFAAVPVTLGAGDRRRVAVTAGLRPGQRIVVRGAFELAAKLATSGLGAHAGHGH